MTGLEILGVVASIGGSIISAAGANSQAQAQANAAEYNAKVADRSAKVAAQQSSSEAEDKRMQMRRQQAQIRAAYGASGLDASGSVLDVVMDTATEQSLDVERSYYQGDITRLGYQDKAVQYRAEAENARTAGRFGMMSALVGGASSLLRSPTASTAMARW